MQITKLALIFMMAAALPASAGTIVLVNAPGGNPAAADGYYSGAEYVGWTMGPTTYNNVTISAALSDYTDPDVRAYLYQGSVGGTLIASATVGINNTSSSFRQLFSGETLLAGDTYFLVISTDSGVVGNNVLWAYANSPSVTLAPGVTNNTPDFYQSGIVDGSIPGSWNQGTGDLLYQVTGTASTAPEPGTIALAAAGLAGLVLRTRRKR